MADQVAPLDVLSAMFKKSGVMKTRKVDKARLVGIFDETKLEKLVAELAEEDVAQKGKEEDAKQQVHKDRFLDACPEGDVVLTHFDFCATGGLEEDKCQYFHGPRWDLRNEFDVQYNCDIDINGTHNGEYFTIALYIDMYQDMDDGDDKVFFETHTRHALIEFPLKFKDAVRALCVGVLKKAKNKIESHIATLESEQE